jgi:hypothetical protein
MFASIDILYEFNLVCLFSIYIIYYYETILIW